MPNQEFPIIYTFREPVAGAQFLAGVDMTGWGLAVRQSDRWVFEGVAPAGRGEPAPSVRDAYLSFLHRMRRDLYPRGEETFGEFKKRSASKVVLTPDQRRRWADAIAAANAGTGLPAELGKMERKQSLDNQPAVTIVQLSQANSPVEAFHRDSVASAA